MWSEFEVRRIRGGEGRDYIRANHYSRSCHNGPMCYGLFRGGVMVGVVAFATPCSEAVRASLFGPEEKDRVTELHRLFVEDGTPPNTESWFVARALKMLKEDRPHLWAAISFADGTEGHVGYIYQALNALYCGTTGRARFWRDGEGRLRHPRQSGVNITPGVAKERGWQPEMRDAKHRYVLLLPNGRNHRRMMVDRIRERYPERPYPKGE